jgi:3D (Asp-Asp-Asp) domain-containing protein
MRKETCLIAVLYVLVGISVAEGLRQGHKANDLKHQVTELEIRSQQQQTQLMESTKAYQVQLESEQGKTAKLQADFDILQKERDTIAAQLAKKTRPVSIASAAGSITGFEITYYNDTGHTFSGAYTQDGVTASVDPKVIPLGTWIEITMPDGTVLKRQAQDTGGAVKGKVVDIYAKASTSDLRKRGRVRGASVRILGKES